MGGLARRVSYLKAFKYRSQEEVPTLFIDAGNLFSNDRYASGKLPEDVMTKNNWVVKSYSQFNHDAANVTYRDLPYIAELLKKDGFQARLAEYPFTKRFISANVHPAGQDMEPLQPYMIREVKLKRGNPGSTMRIGIIGFCEIGSGMPEDNTTEYAGFVMEDPFEAAKRIIPELKKKCDIIIALAYMPQDMAEKLAKDNPDITTLLGARQIGFVTEVKTVNNTAVAFAVNETKYLGELRYYISSDGSLEKQETRYVGLDDWIPNDKAAEENTITANTEYMNLRSKASAASGSPQ